MNIIHIISPLNGNEIILNIDCFFVIFCKQFLLKLTNVFSIIFKVRFGTDVFKTDICKKSLNPQWNSEWFKFEVKSSLCISVNTVNNYRVHAYFKDIAICIETLFFLLWKI